MSNTERSQVGLNIKKCIVNVNYWLGFWHVFLDIMASCSFNLNRVLSYSFKAKEMPFLETKNTAVGDKKGGAKLKCVQASTSARSVQNSGPLPFDLSGRTDSPEADARCCYV